MPRCFASGSQSCAPTVNTGLSELIGSWNTHAMSRPRSACSSSRDAASRSRPWNVIAPLRSALSGRRLTVDIAVTLLPEPDSPTSATVVFSGTSKLTPLTASTRCTTPRSLPRRNETCRSRIESSGAARPCCAHSSPRSLGSSASRKASVMSENAVTKTAMNAVAATSCHQ